MKVLIVFNQPAPYKVNLFSLLAKHVDLTVIFEKRSCPNRHPLFYANNVYDFNHIFLKHGSFGEENSCSSEIIKHLKKNKYDLIILNGYSTLTERKTIRYLNRHKIKWTLFVNGGLIKKESKFKKWYKTRYISSAYSYLSPCKEASNYLKYYGADKERIFIYPNSTIFDKNVLSILPTKEEIDLIRVKYNLPEGKIFICPTQFIPRKNNITLINAFKNRDENLLLVGNGIEEDLYLETIKKNNIKNIYIISYLKTKDLEEVFKACDCLISLSLEDIYGHTINEGMAKALPIIASNKIVAANHLIKNGYNGFIVEPKNLEQINKAIDNLHVIDKNNCLKTSKDNTFEKQTERMIEIIKSGNL